MLVHLNLYISRHILYIDTYESRQIHITYLYMFCMQIDKHIYYMGMTEIWNFHWMALDTWPHFSGRWAGRWGARSSCPARAPAHTARWRTNGSRQVSTATSLSRHFFSRWLSRLVRINAFSFVCWRGIGRGTWTQGRLRSPRVTRTSPWLMPRRCRPRSLSLSLSDSLEYCP
jgi:hypothetical protein